MENHMVHGGLMTDAEVEDYLNSIPIGYRFCPTNEELVVHYLRNKVFNLPLPPNRIIDLNIYKYSPEELSDKYGTPREEKMYFFTTRERNPRGRGTNRAAGNGYWKSSGAYKPVGGKANPIGYTRSLVFYQGERNKAVKTNWLMHEFTLNNEKSSRGNSAPDDMKLDRCVLCQVYKNREKGHNKQSTIRSSTMVDEMIDESEGPLIQMAPNHNVSEPPPMPPPNAMCCSNFQQQPFFQEQNSFLLPTTMAHPAAATTYPVSYDPGHRWYEQNHNPYLNQPLPGDHQMMNVIRGYYRPTPQPHANHDFSGDNIY